MMGEPFCFPASPAVYQPDMFAKCIRSGGIDEATCGGGGELDSSDRPILVADPVPDPSDPTNVKHTVCLFMPTPRPRDEHNEAIAQHIRSISNNRLSVNATIGNWDKPLKVVAAEPIPQGVCIVEAEPCLEGI